MFTQGLDVTDQLLILAGCGPFEERNETIPVMENLQGMPDMLHNKSRKSKGEKLSLFQDLNCKKCCKRLYLIAIIHMMKIIVSIV